MADKRTADIPILMPDKDKTDPLPHPNQRVPLAYENKKFLNGPDGRILRILAEHQEPLSKFRRERIQDTIVFFGSARFRSQEKAQAALQDLQKAGNDTPAGGWPGQVTIKLGCPVLPKVGRGIFLGHAASHILIVGAREADPPRAAARVIS
jgi:hypothetical protein